MTVGASTSAAALEAHAVARSSTPPRRRARDRRTPPAAPAPAAAPSRSVGRSSTCACTGPIAGGAAGARRRGGASATLNTSGSIESARTARLSVSLISWISISRRRPLTVSPTTSPSASAQPARRQRELRALAAGPQILQPDFRAPLGFAVFGHHREVGMRGARRAADQAARARRRGLIVGADIGETDRDFARQVAFLRARQPRRRRVVRQHQVVLAEFDHRLAAALAEAQHAVLLRPRRRRRRAPADRAWRAAPSAGPPHSRPALRRARWCRRRSCRCRREWSRPARRAAPRRAGRSASGRSPSSARRSRHRSAAGNTG